MLGLIFFWAILLKLWAFIVLNFIFFYEVIDQQIVEAAMVVVTCVSGLGEQSKDEHKFKAIEWHNEPFLRNYETKLIFEISWH